MTVFGQSVCTRAKLVVILQSSYLGKVVSFGQKWLCSGKEFLFWTIWLYLCRSGSIRAKVVVFGQNGCIWAK